MRHSYGYVDNNRRTAIMAQASERSYFRPGGRSVDFNLVPVEIPFQAFGADAPAAGATPAAGTPAQAGNADMVGAILGLIGTVATPIVQKWIDNKGGGGGYVAPQVQVSAPPPVQATGTNWLLVGGLLVGAGVIAAVVLNSGD